jgi:hypothetical protein
MGPAANVRDERSTSTMATATRQANLFELKCDSVSIPYSTSSFAGPPQLSYTGPEGTLSFSGNEIETLPSAIGTEVTVTLDLVPDLHTIALTLLLAAFNLPADGDTEFDTLAIKTTHLDTIAGPPQGASQTYEAVALHGTARSVDF